MNPVFLCDAVRTPIGRYGGALASVRADDLAAIPIRALMERNPAADWTMLEAGVRQRVKALEAFLTGDGLRLLLHRFQTLDRWRQRCRLFLRRAADKRQ